MNFHHHLLLITCKLWYLAMSRGTMRYIQSNRGSDAREMNGRVHMYICVYVCVRNIYILFTFSLVDTFTTPVKKVSIKDFTLLQRCVTHHNSRKKYLALQSHYTSVWKRGKNYKRLYFCRTQVDDISNLRSNCPASVKTACQSQHPYRI